jgi:hypothetical protein
MPYVNVDHENSASVNLHYEDIGSGTPVVLYVEQRSCLANRLP